MTPCELSIPLDLQHRISPAAASGFAALRRDMHAREGARQDGVGATGRLNVDLRAG